MAHPVTGKAGVVTIGTVAANFKLTSWTYEATARLIDGSAAGDTWTDRVAIRNDYRAQMEGVALDQAAWDLGQDLVGTEAAFTLKRKSADVNAYVLDTGIVESCAVEHPHDNATTVRLVVLSSDGSAGPTVDTTPAT